ncbi:MAG: outer membrane lipoprotein-sorting protein [Armatimonadetes bacterium]|nr:outer membrane lipoprotein-sorting protein [Armatimonadota bacterium]
MMTTTLAAMILGGTQSTNIDSYLPFGLKDITFNVSMTKRNSKELGKIDQSFVQQYSIDSATVRAKEPFKLRMDARSDETTVMTIVNGGSKLISVPALRIKKKSNVSEEPGQRQTLMDFILLTPAAATDFLHPKFVRFDRQSGDPVFDLTFASSLNYPVRHRVWIDKDEHYVTRREWYGTEGQLRATFLFSSPVKVKGIYVPTVMQVLNADNKLAGETKYTNIKVNEGLSDSIFDI